MSVLDIVEPGKSRARALILYEMYGPSVLLARYQFEGAELKCKLEELYSLLETVWQILSWEASSSHEGRISEYIRMQGLPQLRTFISNIK